MNPTPPTRPPDRTADQQADQQADRTAGRTADQQAGRDPDPAPAAAEALPRIAVVVPHLNQPEHLARSLDALAAQSFDMRRVEVAVVDNGSRALPREIVARLPGARLIEEPEPGPGPARNAGVAATSAPLLAFVDADCVADPDWLAVIAAGFDADPGLKVLGGDVRILTENPARPGPIEAYEAVFAFRQREYIRKMGFSGTGNLAMRREVFEAVGPFAGIGAAEDADWGRRARAMGVVTRYEPRMVVHHPARASLDELRRKWDRQISHQFNDEAGGPAGKAKWAAKTAAMALSPIAEIPRILRSDRIPDMRARVLAFGTLARIRAYRARRMAEALFGGAARGASAGWNR